jgi:hypothetical protein
MTGRSSTPRLLDSSLASLEYWVARSSRAMTAVIRFPNNNRHTFAISRLDTPELCQKFPYPPNRGRREHRVHAAPAVSCANLHKGKRTRAYRFSGGNPAFPAQWLTAYNVLSGDRACLTPPPREYGFVRPVGLAKPPRDLTPTVEASGPHDFAVRRSAVRLRAQGITHGNPPCDSCARGHRRVHRIPPRVNDDGQRPSVGRDGELYSLICISDKQKYFFPGG